MKLKKGGLMRSIIVNLISTCRTIRGRERVLGSLKQKLRIGKNFQKQLVEEIYASNIQHLYIRAWLTAMQTLKTFTQQLQIRFTNDFVLVISVYYSALFLA